MGSIDHSTAKSIHLKTNELENRCCRKLSIFASLCATVSIIINAYNLVDYTSSDYYLNNKARSVIRSLLEVEIQQKIDAYFTATSSHRLRREALLDKPSAVEDNNVTPHVEFFNPKMRSELEEKDDVEQRRTGSKGPAPGGDTWVWLTSYSRVPYKVVQGFCKATQDYCPPGVQGPKGSSGAPGPKGDRGDPGISGIPGSPGAKGPVGPPGPRGERGFPGNPGLDGRDGVPGEPGLDGMSGRNGADGAPGKDGKDGMPGRDGMPGKNGKDGKDGKQGPQGPQGPKGLKGDRGPQGLKGVRGTDGQDGMPGKPGISAYSYAKEKELLIPPTFAKESEKVIIDENEFLRLPCTAAGKPEPTLEWRRTDSAAIYNGAWRDGTIPGRWLNITNISRHHSGKYICLANNGIQRPVNKTFEIQVRFSPFIRVRDNEVFAFNRTAVLECEVQAWPEPVMNWNTDNTPIDDNHPRYKPERVATDLPWRWIMKLHIPFVKDTDLKEYRCVAKNDNLKNNMTTEGIIKVKIPDPNQKPIRRMGQFEWGSIPPKFTSLEELCQIQDCPVCTQCERSKLTITPLRDSSLNFRKPRQTRCQLYAIGKPVFHKSVDEQFGTWLRDSWPSSPEQENRLWSTDENENSILKEFNDKVTFKKNKPDRTYRLPRPFFGNGHIMYNGSFFYQEASSTRPGKIIKYDLMTSRLEDELLPYAGGRLYSSGHNQVDFNADDNGLWVIYSLKDSNNTAVAKLNLDDTGRIRFDHIWNISLHHGLFGEMFIVCGVLYGLESNTERDTRVNIAIDLFLNKPLEIPTLSFTNPFKKTTLLGYDHRHKELYSWDRGNHLTYPVRYNELPGP